MRERLILLEASVRGDLEVIDELYAALGRGAAGSDAPEERLIVSAYLLHNLYTAFENVFRNIALAFENALDDRSGWHRQLLERMRLDLGPIRPAVIDDAAYVALDELLRFRHLFRSAYSARLDAGRLALVLRAAEELRPLYRPQIERFLEFVKAGG
ncbi:MAG TPA: antitoxin [Thermoanaerobaculia bacterium]